MFSGSSGGEIYTVFDEESESEVENREILHPAIAIGAEPTGPVISRSGKSIGGKTEEQQDQAVHAESLMMPNAIEKYPHKKRAPESAPNPYKERF